MTTHIDEVDETDDALRRQSTVNDHYPSAMSSRQALELIDYVASAAGQFLEGHDEAPSFFELGNCVMSLLELTEDTRDGDFLNSRAHEALRVVSDAITTLDAAEVQGFLGGMRFAIWESRQ